MVVKQWIIFHLAVLRSLMRTLMDYSSRDWLGIDQTPISVPAREDDSRHCRIPSVGEIIEDAKQGEKTRSFNIFVEDFFQSPVIYRL